MVMTKQTNNQKLLLKPSANNTEECNTAFQRKLKYLE